MSTINDVNATAELGGVVRNYAVSGLLGNTRFSQMNISNINIIADCKGYDKWAYVGGLTGICSSYVFMIFTNYTSQLTFNKVTGPTSALLGEINGYMNNQHYLDWGTMDGIKNTYLENRTNMLIFVNNSKIEGRIVGSIAGGYFAVCLGSAQNGSIAIN